MEIFFQIVDRVFKEMERQCGKTHRYKGEINFIIRQINESKNVAHKIIIHIDAIANPAQINCYRMRKDSSCTYTGLADYPETKHREQQPGEHDIEYTADHKNSNGCNKCKEKDGRTRQ